MAEEFIVNPEQKMEIIYIILTSIFSLAGVWLGSYLSKRQAHNQSILETRLNAYARLLSAIYQEENYPRDIVGTADSYFEEKVADHNKEVKKWRGDRRVIKGLAMEALLMAQGEKLRNKLSDFISSHDPESIKNLRGEEIEKLMRKEIEI